jgi:hypothetical protein
LSIELLSKNTADVFNAFFSQPNWHKVELEEGIKTLLLQIREIQILHYLF